jgi:predicted nucleotide-binding protein (sugar kinase/HSP70/actin superfamily)
MAKTVLFGGLTPVHELFLKGAVEAFGYRAQFLPTPDNRSLAVGREFCNRGMCNPTYYTVGNLIKFLLQEKAKGVNVEEEYLFVTVGACGPCRFGMYESEYRHALKEAGFPNFKVSILNQSDLSSEGDFELTPKLVWHMVKAVWLADVVRDLGYQLRPYEVKEGSVNRVLEQYQGEIYRSLKGGAGVKELLKVLKGLRAALEELPFYYARVKPVVSVIGEFWAHTTEGDGNYKIHRWLEEEGAEVRPEPIAGWIDYQLFMEEEKLKRDLKVKGFSVSRVKKLLAVKAMAKTFRGLYDLFRSVFSFRPKELPSQKLLARLAAPYFDHFVVGGEGHLEVAKHLYAVKFRKAHMVVSVKPFGCMPSTQSDGAQAKVLSDYPNSIFISVETSGDGEVNVKSRVQMKLFEAKRSAQEEFETLLKELSLSKEAVERAFSSLPELRKPFVPLKGPYAGTAARALRANAKKVSSFALAQLEAV